MEPFYLVFMILGAGFGIATLVFVLELITMKLGNKFGQLNNDSVGVAGKHESRAETSSTDTEIIHDELTGWDNNVGLPGVVTKEDDIEVIETTSKETGENKGSNGKFDLD